MRVRAPRLEVMSQDAVVRIASVAAWCQERYQILNPKYVSVFEYRNLNVLVQPLELLIRSGDHRQDKRKVKEKKSYDAGLRALSYSLIDKI